MRRLAVAVCLVALLGAGVPMNRPVLATEIDEGPPVGDRVVDQAQRNRQTFGFQSDRAFVLRSYADRTVFADHEWGMPLTKAEAVEVARRVAVQHAIDPAGNWAFESAPETFAGKWIDQAADGRAVFMVVKGADATRAGIAARMPGEIAYDVQWVTRSWDDLVATQETIDAAQPELAAAGIEIISTGIHTPSNSVLVGLPERDPTVERKLVDRFGDGLTFRTDVPATADSCPWTNCLPVKGGMRITSGPINNPCTAGWMVRVDGYFAILTAGHCFRAGGDSGYGDNWTHVDGGVETKIGDALRETWYNEAGADVGLIKLTRIPTDRNDFVAYSSGDTRIRSATDVAADSEQDIGEYICRMGSNTKPGRLCGFLVTLNVRKPSKTYFGTRYIRHQNEIAIDSLGGDSGGSVFSGPEAYGTHTHSTDPPASPLSWYSTINQANIEYSSRHGSIFTVCTTTACGG
jgi:hypothetical protein